MIRHLVKLIIHLDLIAWLFELEFFFCFRTGFHPIIGGGRLIRLCQALFLLKIVPDILRVRPWKELLATEAQATSFI